MVVVTLYRARDTMHMQLIKQRHCTGMVMLCVVGRPCPVMLQNLPISQVYKSHIFHLLVSRLTPISLNEMYTSRKIIMTCYCTVT